MLLLLSLVINEVGSLGQDSGWVEIFNNGNSPENLNGYFLVTKNKVLPLSGVINSGEYKVFHIGLSMNSDSVSLKKGSITIDSYSWISLPSSGSVGRYPDGSGGFRIFLVPTPGRKNELPSSLDEQSWGKIKALFGPRR
ncbi:MAG: lamin tail domain-containing protein [Candidatus Caldipriscus sp.]